MMKRFEMRVSLTVSSAVMIWGAVAHAEPGAFVNGMGSKSCSQFIASIGKLPPGKMQKMPTAAGDFVSENAEYQQWLLGFVSGFNAAHANDAERQIKDIDLAGIDLWMRNWCNQHPTGLVFDGGIAFIDQTRSNPTAAGQR